MGQQFMPGPEGEDSLRQGIKIVEGLVGDFPQVPVYREVLAEVLNRLCNVLNGSDRQAEAELVATESLAIWEKLAAEHPEVPNYLRGVGDGLTYVAFNLMNRGAWEEACPLLERAVASQKAAVETNHRTGDIQAL